MTTTYVIKGFANTVIKHKALIFKTKIPHSISKYGRIMLYKGKV